MLAAVVAMAIAAGTAASVGAQWPTACVELNDVVERHLGNHGNVGIYQRVFGADAERACQFDHRDDVAGTFIWALTESDGTGTVLAAPTAAVSSGSGGWPETCVELNDIVEGQLENEQNVGIYQRVFGNAAEAACRRDHADDVRSVFAWATPCDVQPPLAARAESPGPTIHQLAGTNAALHPVLLALPWLGCYSYAWLADGTSANDMDSLWTLHELANHNQEFARYTANLDWFADGVNYNYPEVSETNTLAKFIWIARLSADLSSVIMTYPWLSDSVSYDETIGVQGVANIARHNLDIGMQVATSSWVFDGISYDESLTLSNLEALVKFVPEIAQTLVRFTLDPAVRPIDVQMLTGMYEIYYATYDTVVPSERFHRVVNARWFRDGLNAREREFIVELGMVQGYLDFTFDQLFNNFP
ncbi:MAG: hypothetical protein OXG17_03955 [Chloroflexi bacterium]|nr:hypothetical protein [Chloroflexota bacterium]